MISDLTSGMSVVGLPVLIREIKQGTARNGNPYVDLVLVDATGTARAKAWDSTPESMGIHEGDVVRANGRADSYRGELQVVLQTVDVMTEEQALQLLDQVLPQSPVPLATRYEGLHLAIGHCGRYRETVAAVLGASENFVRWIMHPAGARLHHAYVGGLAEHCLSMASSALTLLAGKGPYHRLPVDRELVVAGCLVHDIGKLRELTVRGTYTDDGKLLGHIVLGIQLLQQAPGDPEVVDRLVHLVASHHGTREMGAAVEPASMEAVILHQLDMLDSRTNGLLTISQGVQGDWTPRGLMFGREMLAAKETL